MFYFNKIHNYDYSQNQCPRVKNNLITENEKHPCYFCGHPIPVTVEDCSKCSIMPCPECGKCYCDVTFDDKFFLYLFHTTCCHNIYKSNGVEDLPKYLQTHSLAKTCQKAFDYCKKQIKSKIARVYVIDIDGTITLDPKINYKKYEKARPNLKVIEAINELFNRGHIIYLFSARHEEDREVTKKWLKQNKVKWNKLILGKPLGDYYVDDRSLIIEDFLKE
jgi:hypothetical protein